jgi:hypothetical protein
MVLRLVPLPVSTFGEIAALGLELTCVVPGLQGDTACRRDSVACAAVSGLTLSVRAVRLARPTEGAPSRPATGRRR